ncbi:MAG: FecCD family ABC transporter permease [Planctomycetota bacterium]|jgi:iron complex transport system permease protein
MGWLRRPWILGILLACAWILCIGLELVAGSDIIPDFATALQGAMAGLGMGEALEGNQQAIMELRLWRAICAGLVGASLALSGALLQGLFRNGLAEPGILGLNAGATLGASLAILVLGGYGAQFLDDPGLGASPFLITGFAFVGSVGTGVFIMLVASFGGRVSVPTLLLTGIAVNACISGLLAAIQSAVLADFEVQRALMSWTWGTLDDRGPTHAAMVGSGLLLSALVIPFVAVELDLFAAGEEDASALGVPVGLTKLLVLGAAALSCACAVAVAGQIAFLGLVVPHLIRLLVGSSHRHLLILSLLGGAVFLLTTDLIQRNFFGAWQLQPGVMMSLIGGPFFLYLLFRRRRSLGAW